MGATIQTEKTSAKADKPKKNKGKGKGKGKGRRGKKDKKDKKKNKKDKKNKGPKMAETADRYALYQKAVQNPEVDIEFFQRAFKDQFGRAAQTLREDFCGCFWTACEWVKGGDRREAIGVDLDPEPLAYGREKNMPQLTEEQRSRLTLVQGNVLDPRDRKVDVVAAQNFSYSIFKTRAELRRYFEVAREGLNDEGVLVLDLYGGPESQTVQEEGTEHEEDGFTYWWDQKSYDAITSEAKCAIHFTFPDKSKITDAFEYDWRLWTIAELRELLLEAGFSKAVCYWDETDEDDDDDYQPKENAETYQAWIAYIVGVR